MLSFISPWSKEPYDEHSTSMPWWWHAHVLPSVAGDRRSVLHTQSGPTHPNLDRKSRFISWHTGGAFNIPLFLRWNAKGSRGQNPGYLALQSIVVWAQFWTRFHENNSWSEISLPESEHYWNTDRIFHYKATKETCLGRILRRIRATVVPFRAGSHISPLGPPHQPLPARFAVARAPSR